MPTNRTILPHLSHGPFSAQATRCLIPSPQMRGFSSSIRTVCCGLMLLACASAVWAQPGGGPKLVVVTPVVEQSVASGQTFVGTTTPVRSAVVGSAVDGRVLEYPIREGDFVRAGDPLTQLLTATISLEIEAAEAELELRQHEHAELKNGSLKEEIEQARAMMLAAQADQEYQTKRLGRTEELFQRNAINSEELQLTLAQKIKADQDYNQAVANFQLIEQGPREERIQQAASQVKIQQAVVDRLTDQLGKHTMRAPFDGYIAAEHSEEGQWVQRGELVAEVIALNQVDVLTYVPEQVIRFVRRGEQVNVEIPALPDHLFRGKVALIIPQADVQARTFPVKVRIENIIDEDGPLIKSGMMARVTLPIGNKRESLVVPKDAIVLGGPQKLVYAVVPEQGEKPMSVRAVPVITGASVGEGIVVQGELSKDDQIVIRGNDRLRPGATISITQTITPPSTQTSQNE